jgi:cytoskeleton protein RodZ
VSDSGENKSDQQKSVDMQPPGFRLRRAREVCELSREDVATHLKLSVEKIEGLEQGEVESIAAPVFVAGYLRSYARLVNLSGDEIVADFKALTAMESPSVDPTSGPAANDYGQVGKASSLNMSLSGNSGIAGTLIVGTVVVLLVIAGYVYFTGGGEIFTKNNDDIDVSSGKVLLQDTLPEILEPTKLAPINSSSGKKELPKKVTKAAIPAPFSASSNEETSASVQAGSQSSDKLQSAKSSELILYFTEDSWVDVKDSQNIRLLYRIGKEGMSHTVTGLAPFNVRLGFVNGVNIVYNGESYDLSRFENRKSARFKIGKEGDQMGRGQ